jgi:hypothetical protein
MQQITFMNKIYEELPLINFNAPKVGNRRKRTGKPPTEESIKQDQEDAIKAMNLAGLDDEVSLDDKIEPVEKYMIETMPGKSSKSASVVPGGMRKPHYTRLFVFNNKMVFQAACCLPLRVIAASLDCDTVSGRVLYSAHSEKEGGKLVYEFQGEGSELIIDVKRGDSTKAQRLIFKR